MLEDQMELGDVYIEKVDVLPVLEFIGMEERPLKDFKSK